MSLEMLADIDKNTVDFMPQLRRDAGAAHGAASRFPNLLVNGSNGIAVGMATNVPPHNLGEVIDAYVALIDNRDISIEELMAYLPYARGSHYGGSRWEIRPRQVCHSFL